MPQAGYHNRKRHGKHHKRTNKYVKVYAPYLPLVISIITSLLLSIWRPAVNAHTLAYATEMSVSGLLSATNSQRAANGVGALAVNSQLNSAAQAKANDMIARNYWSHTTPDGQEPWIFIDGTGYKYVKAGENLAYGFASSSSAVDGWMNSPSHRENMLDGSFSNVGFGFANGSNYNGDGEQTVVVAMYASPHTLPATTQPAKPTSPAVESTESAPPAAEAAPAPAPADTEAQPETEKKQEPATTDKRSNAALKSKDVNRGTAITGATWTFGAVSAVLAVMIVFRIFHFGIKLKRALKHYPKLWHALQSGEHFVMHHPLLDSTILGLAILSYTLSQVVGIVL